MADESKPESKPYFVLIAIPVPAPLEMYSIRVVGRMPLRLEIYV